MRDKIKILKIDGDYCIRVPMETTIFPGGEPHVAVHCSLRGDDILIDARLCSADGLMTMLVAADAVRRAGAKSYSLFCPYFPGARQDRVTAFGTALTADVYASIIRNFGFKKIFIVDPHSDVTPALLGPSCVVIQQYQVIGKHMGEFWKVYDGLISPDAGATKKAYLSGRILGVEVIAASKERNPTTGALSEFRIGGLRPGKYLIVDDICDGGGTFIGLAEAINAKGSRNVQLSLYTTHGIYSKGTQTLNNLFENIYCTDSFGDWEQATNDMAIKCLPLFDEFWDLIKEEIA